METEKYNKEWFKNRAFKSLRKINDGIWDFSDSLLLYTNLGSGIYEQLQEADTPYFNLVTKPEHEYLKEISKNIADILPKNFEYIDLGPGTEHKEQFLFDELKKQGKVFNYIPVDISDYFLDVAETNAIKQDIKVKRIKTSFEELAKILGKPTIPRFVSIGLTFSNYNPDEVMILLKGITGENGFVFINTQMRNRVDMVALQKVYQEDALHLADEKIQFIGLDPLTDITPRFADDGFKVWGTIINSNDKLQEIGINTGDKLLVFQSLRYTKELLQDALKNEDYIIFDMNSSFIASVIKT